MKKTFINIKGSGLRALIGGFALLALLSFVLPQAAQAAGVGTSGGARSFVPHRSPQPVHRVFPPDE